MYFNVEFLCLTTFWFSHQLQNDMTSEHSQLFRFRIFLMMHEIVKFDDAMIKLSQL